MRFFKELQRRNVFRVGIAYAVEVIYHPAFDGIRDTGAYQELLNQYHPNGGEGP